MRPRRPLSRWNWRRSSDSLREKIPQLTGGGGNVTAARVQLRSLAVGAAGEFDGGSFGLFDAAQRGAGKQVAGHSGIQLSAALPGDARLPTSGAQFGVRRRCPSACVGLRQNGRLCGDRGMPLYVVKKSTSTPVSATLKLRLLGVKFSTYRLPVIRTQYVRISGIASRNYPLHGVMKIDGNE